MRFKSHSIIYLITAFLLISIYACNHKKSKEQRTLLVYCGITMIEPMTELKAIIEEQENCKIEITKGGSGNLLKAYEQSGIGDLYLPGAESYIFSALEKGYITDTASVGINKLALMVQKGNPLNIEANLESLLNDDFYVVIGNPNSGSVGKMTKKVLRAVGIFEKVEQNAIRFTTDSKDLVHAIKNKEADLVVNWYATYTWNDNDKYMDILCIPELEESVNKLIIGQLHSSECPEISKKFIELAKSPRGQAIFEKYGLK